MKNKKLIIVLGTICTSIIFLLAINFLSGNILLNGIGNIIGSQIEEANLDFSFYVYDNQDENNIKAIVNLKNDEGLDYIIKPDNTKIECFGRKEISIDTNNELGKTGKFICKTLSGSEEERQMTITQDLIDNLSSFNKMYNDDGVSYKNQITYQKSETTDTTYYKIGNQNNTWINYKNGIITLALDDIYEYTTSGLRNVATIPLYLKKQDKAGNIIYTNVDAEVYASSRFDVFRFLEKRGKPLSYFGFTANTPNNQSSGFDLYNLRYGHGTYAGSYSGYFTMSWANIGLNDANSVSVEFGLYGNSGYGCQSSANASVDVYYTDGTNNSSNSVYHTGTEKSYTLNVNIDQTKTINYIKMNIWGYDNDYSSFYGYVKNIFVNV